MVSEFPKEAMSEVLLENKLVLISSTALESSDKKAIPDVLYNSPLLFREIGSAAYGYGRIYQSKKIQSKMAIQLTSNEAVKQAVIAGAWYFDNTNNWFEK
jgi:hypothetical protein